MPRKRPTAVLVIAIFHFIFAACGGIVNMLQVTGAAANLTKLGGGGRDDKEAKLQQKIQEDIEREIEKNFPDYKLFQTAEGAFGLVLAGMLLVAGIGLLSMQPWARLLSLLYAVLAILNNIVGAIIAFALVVPATQEALRNMPEVSQQLRQTIEIASMSAVGVGLCVGMVYPIAVLIVMLMPTVTAAFRAPAIDYRDELRDEGDDEQYRREDRWRD
jgi:hypothetical protein